MAAVETFLKSETIFRFAASLRLLMTRPEPQPETEADDGRTRRNFVLEMMDQCPEAFASEESVRGAMYCFSDRF